MGYSGTFLIRPIRRPPSQCSLACGFSAELSCVPRDSSPRLGSVPKSRTQSRFYSEHLLVIVLRQHAVLLVPGHEWALMLPAWTYPVSRLTGSYRDNVSRHA